MKAMLRCVLGSLLLVATLAGAQSSPDALVKSTADEVLAVMRQNSDPQTLRALAEAKVLPHFDFVRMTRLAVGRPWQSASAAQQEALVKGFRTLLVDTYSAAISNGVTPADKIDVKPPQGGGDDVLIKTIAHRGGKPPIGVDYRVAKNAGAWKVYDVIVEGVSLVQTYRGTFSTEIARSGIDGLIRTLEQKTSGKQTS
ncbi:MAG: ABC transporter substrate-binding protein [Betaproteobacteria bacterium]|nr:MAG: ABC transporter substrate-binding protein [Betaproteobacteria bacterium]